MAPIRECVADDITAVADLFMRVFRKRDEPAPASMRSYFAEMYLGNPWLDPSRRPLVAVDDQGHVIRFLGTLPMRGRKLEVAIGGSYMVDPRHHDPLAAVQLLKRFLAGSQDLAITDTANPVAVRFWRGLSGHVAPSRRFAGCLRFARHRSLSRWPIVGVIGTRWVCATTHPSRRSLTSSVPPARHNSASPGTVPEFEWMVGMMRRLTRFGPLRLLTLQTGVAQPSTCPPAATEVGNR
jgi:hypothetical protein